MSVRWGRLAFMLAVSVTGQHWISPWPFKFAYGVFIGLFWPHPIVTRDEEVPDDGV